MFDAENFCSHVEGLGRRHENGNLSLWLDDCGVLRVDEDRDWRLLLVEIDIPHIVSPEDMGMGE